MPDHGTDTAPADTVMLHPDRTERAHPVLSPYVEAFWLPTIGPIPFVVLRRFALLADHLPMRFEWRDAPATAGLALLLVDARALRRRPGRRLRVGRGLPDRGGRMTVG